jgi:hypothetical protein
VEVFHLANLSIPREGSIVRAEARKLRARLAKHYEEDGQSHPIRIEFLREATYIPDRASAAANSLTGEEAVRLLSVAGADVTAPQPLGTLDVHRVMDN